MKTMLYTDGYGRRVIRKELVGEEGGIPPIKIVWEEYGTGRVLGRYERRHIDEPARMSGPMFA